jgi:hypothetical protein
LLLRFRAVGDLGLPLLQRGCMTVTGACPRLGRAPPSDGGLWGVAPLLYFAAVPVRVGAAGSVRLAAAQGQNVNYGSYARSQHDLERADTAVWPRLDNLSTSPLIGPRPTNDRKRQWL